MLANKCVFVFTLSITLTGCAIPAVSKQGAKVKVVSASNCKFVGNIMSIYRDPKTGNLNYKNSHQQTEEYQSNLVRDRASALGANQVVRVYTTRDQHVENQISFYSAHKCKR